MADPETARWPARDDHGDLMRALTVLLMLAGCGIATQEAPVNETDPAITDALADPIMADPRLALQDRGGAIGVPTAIDGGDHALTLGQIATARIREKAFAGCNAKIDYAFAWMAKIPADLDLPAAATVSEAAGSNAKGCNLRIIRYAITRPVAEVDAFYREKGFVLSGGGGIVSGIRAADGAAYWVSIAATKTGTTVDFVSNRGR
jgi:hypothetical protein